MLMVQAVYQQRARGQSFVSVANEYIKYHLDIKPIHYDRDFFDTMISYLSQQQINIVDKLHMFETPEWRYERMDPVLVSILILGAAELSCQPNTPAKVILNEYIELTKDFLTEKDAKFVNVILDKILQDVDVKNIDFPA